MSREYISLFYRENVFCSSMDGEGNFNWRFVYDFSYLPAERCISVKKKEYFWSYDATELTVPPVLNLQVWDNDKFSADDFLGRNSLLISVPMKMF